MIMLAKLLIMFLLLFFSICTGLRIIQNLLKSESLSAIGMVFASLIAVFWLLSKIDFK